MGFLVGLDVGCHVGDGVAVACLVGLEVTGLGDGVAVALGLRPEVGLGDGVLVDC